MTDFDERVARMRNRIGLVELRLDDEPACKIHARLLRAIKEERGKADLWRDEARSLRGALDDVKRFATAEMRRVETCASCRYAEGLGQVAALCMFDTPRCIRADGTGFCSWHEPQNAGSPG